MILKQLKHSLDDVIDEIYESKEHLYDYKNIVSVDIINGNIDIRIDDEWLSAYTYQIYDYDIEKLDNTNRNSIKTEILLNSDRLYSDLRILIEDAYSEITTYIDDIVNEIQTYKNTIDTYYLYLNVINGQVESYLDIDIETCYAYTIFDTSELKMIEGIENKEIDDNELKELILDATKEKILEWEFILENFEQEE